MKTSFNDKPLSSGDTSTKERKKFYGKSDSLGTQDYAEALSQFIRECDTPMTIGIQGDWGIGKTSLLNMIHAYLQGTKGKEYGMVIFNTWHYSLFGQDEYLGIAAISGILNQIKEGFSLGDNDELFKKATSIIGNVLKSTKFSAFGISVDASTIKTESQYPYETKDDISALMLGFKNKFEKLINKIVNENSKIEKVVFFIDDLDRVKPIKALELLESIKNFLDVEHCVFVLAVDYEVVQMGMAQKFGIDLQKTSGKSFFDKIIQLPFTMPSSSYNIGHYIKGLLSDINFSISEDDLNFYEEITSVTVGRNPRSIKRIVNYAHLIRIIRQKHSKKETRDSMERQKLLYALLCMQVAWPEIFNYFVKSPTVATIKNIENWDHLDQIPFIDKLYNRTPNVDQLKSNISAYFDLFFELLDKKEPFGLITRDELEPVWDILRIARLTVDRDFRQPFDVFTDLVKENNADENFKKIVDLYKKSKWITSNVLDYKLSGKRYITIVYKRKQIGSLVSLKSSPFIFRLDMEEEAIQEAIKSKSVEDANQEHTKIVESVTNESLTGFGQSIILTDILLQLKEKRAIELLNMIFQKTITKYS